MTAPPLLLPRSPALFGETWSGPATPPAPAVLSWAAGAGAVAGVSLTTDRAGVGWLVASAAVVLAVAVVGPRSAKPTVRHWVWSGAGLALMAVGTVRAAEWLFPLCAVTACVARALALARGRSVRDMAMGIGAVVFAPVRAVPWVAKGVAEVRKRTGRGPARVAGTVAVTGLLVLVFGALFAGADAAFATVVDRVMPSVDGGSVVRWIVLAPVFGMIVAGACYWLAAPPDLEAPATRRKPLRRFEWAVPVGVLVAMFAAFVLVQLTVLFGGREYVLSTAGVTAAEYARRGFWQLCVVTLLALLVIRVVARRASVDTKTDRVWLRSLLGGLTVLTLVIVGSALTRMWAYQEAYGYTVLRLLVATCELWLGLVCLMVLTAGVHLRAEWLPRAVVRSAMAALLGLAVLNPDAYVAERNVARYAHTGKIDLHYLGTLSVDAAPELARLPEPARSCALSEMRKSLDAYGDDGWQGWNLSRAEARRLIGNSYIRPANCG
jgi:hypothetical protein